MTRRYRFRYDIQKADLEALIKAHYNSAEIAALYGCDRSLIYQRAASFGLSVKAPIIQVDREKLNHMLANAPKNRMAAE